MSIHGFNLLKCPPWEDEVLVMSVGYRNTACGHNDFCSVRLNGPDAKVSCPSGCYRIILPLLYLIATLEIVPTKTRSRS